MRPFMMVSWGMRQERTRTRWAVDAAVAAGGISLWVRYGQTGIGLLLLAGGAAAVAWAVQRARNVARHRKSPTGTDAEPGTATTENEG
jgi:hypothetical protein